MVKVGKWIAKHRILMLIIGVLLIIPSVIGIAKTKVNYDLLSYLPDHLETVKGQDILVDEFGMGAFSMVAVENMDMKDVQKLEKEFEKEDASCIRCLCSCSHFDSIYCSLSYYLHVLYLPYQYEHLPLVQLRDNRSKELPEGAYCI